MRVLFFGDIFASPGRRAVEAALPRLRARYAPDLVIGNAENLSGGRGMNQKAYSEMKAAGFDAFTSGNHVWDNKEILPLMESDSRVLRPANYPSPAFSPCPGRGHVWLECSAGRLLLVNLMGRTFLDSIDCPFAAVDRILAEESPGGAAVFVDMHAETTSEKAAMGWFLAGRVSAVVGTHTHVQTSDETILPGGTAFLTDVGMTGSFHSCIGMEPEAIVARFRTRRPQPLRPAETGPGFGCVLVDIDREGKATAIRRIRQTIASLEKEGEESWPA